MVDAIRAAGGAAALAIHPEEGHGVHQRVYADDRLYEWFLAHRSGQEPVLQSRRHLPRRRRRARSRLAGSA